MDAIRLIVFFVLVLVIFCPSCDGFDSMNAIRQIVFFVMMLVTFYFVNSNFSFDDLAYNLLSHI